MSEAEMIEVVRVFAAYAIGIGASCLILSVFASLSMIFICISKAMYGSVLK